MFPSEHSEVLCRNGRSSVILNLNLTKLIKWYTNIFNALLSFHCKKGFLVQNYLRIVCCLYMDGCLYLPLCPFSFFLLSSESGRFSFDLVSHVPRFTRWAVQNASQPDSLHTPKYIVRPMFLFARHVLFFVILWRKQRRLRSDSTFYWVRETNSIEVKSENGFETNIRLIKLFLFSQPCNGFIFFSAPGYG